MGNCDSISEGEKESGPDGEIDIRDEEDIMAPSDHDFKVVLIGPSSVGKTCVIQRYWKNIFDEGTVSTIGVDFASKNIIHKGKKIRLQIWDTAGQERYRSFSEPYYRNSKGAVLVYDITDSESFEKALEWNTELRKHRKKEECLMLLLGNKCDLDHHRTVGKEQGKEFSKSIEASVFFETSAKNGTNINTAFTDFVDKLYQYFVGEDDDDDDDEEEDDEN